MKSVPVSVLLASAMLLAGGCNRATAHSDTAAPASAPAQGPEHLIEIKNYMFMEVTVPQGTKVTWVNRDDVPHTVVEKTKVFRSAALDTGDSYSHVFDQPGTYEYYCSIHPFMIAKVIVTPAGKTG